MGTLTKAEGGLRCGYIWISGAFFAFLLFVGMVHLSYQLDARERGGDELMVIRAAEGPFKIPPPKGSDAGTVPYQDVGVYNRLENTPEELAALDAKSGEQLLPPPEEPAQADDGLPRILNAPDEPVEGADITIPSNISEMISREAFQNAYGGDEGSLDEATARIPQAAKDASDEVAALLEAAMKVKTDAAVAAAEIKPYAKRADTKKIAKKKKKVEEPVKVAKAEPVPIPAPVPKKAEEPKKTAKTETVKARETVPKIKKEPEVDVAALAPKPPPKGSHVVQLGAFRKRAEAEDAWRRVARANKDVLGSMSPIIVKADIPEKGIYYRLRVGPMENRSSAKSLCKLLDKRNQACIVTKS